MDNSQSGSYFTFRDPSLSAARVVVTDYAAALTWAFGLLAYVAPGLSWAPPPSRFWYLLFWSRVRRWLCVAVAGVLPGSGWALLTCASQRWHGPGMAPDGP